MRITGYVDPDERRLAIQALIIGVVVFAVVLPRPRLLIVWGQDERLNRLEHPTLDPDAA